MIVLVLLPFDTVLVNVVTFASLQVLVNYARSSKEAEEVCKEVNQIVLKEI